MNIFEEILKWSKDQKMWKQVALRKIWNGSLNSKAVDEILEILKDEIGNDGLGITKGAAPISEHDLPKIAKGGETYTLQAMYDLTNVNAISPQENILFAEDGLTVIYGENGAGKSGYSRVLKKACRARNVEPILPNVFDKESTIFDEPRASFLINGVQVDWVDKEGEKGADSLATIAVFDSKCARTYINGKNNMYMPYGLDVFSKLGTLCSKLKEKLEKEQGLTPLIDLPRDILEIPDTNKVGQLIKQINSIKIPLNEKGIDEYKKVLTSLIEFSEDEEKKLAELRINQSKDPIKLAQQKKRLKEKALSLYKSIVRRNSLLGQCQFDYMENNIRCSESAKRASEIASKKMIEVQPLNGVGTDEWTVFIKSAEEYAKIAYPNSIFPIADEDKLCLYCQQKLEAEACFRLKAFYQHIEQKEEKEAAKYLSQYEKNWKEIERLKNNQVNDNELLVDIKEVNHRLGEEIETYFKESENIFQHAKEAYKSCRWTNMDTLNSSIAKRIINFIKSIEDEIENLEAISKLEERKKIEDELGLLESRKLLATHQNVILERLKRIRQLSLIKACISATNPRGISEKGAELAEQAVTKELKDGFKEELEKLGAEQIKVNLIDKPSSGKVTQQIQLTGDAPKKTPLVSSVLSEGEQCAVALASFMAELRAGKQTCGIIFDDPVSSLDHRWRQAIARRLVEEGENRQVIIFTHDVVFLMELIEIIEKIKKVPVHIQLLEAKHGCTGFCSNELPWECTTARDRIGTLEQDLHLISAAKKRGENYSKIARSFYEKLRETWERTVELDLFGGVITRFQPSVKTQSLRHVIIDKHDFEAINKAMSHCSQWTHDTPIAKQPPIPKPEQMKSDIEELMQYLDGLKVRQEEAEKVRKEEAEPPKPKIVSFIPSKAKKEEGQLKITSKQRGKVIWTILNTRRTQHSS